MYKCIRDPFYPSHPSQLCIIRELPTTLRRPIADPKIRAEWRTIGRTRGRRLASTHNGRHYRCNDLSSPSRFPDMSWLENCCLKMPALLFQRPSKTMEKLISKCVFLMDYKENHHNYIEISSIFSHIIDKLLKIEIKIY